MVQPLQLKCKRCDRQHQRYSRCSGFLLDRANFPGPFTAGVNQVIPYEAFGGDGMLTRLLLKLSDKAPWSDNGTAKNPALPPVEKLGKGLYFMNWILAGTKRKSDKEL